MRKLPITPNQSVTISRLVTKWPRTPVSPVVTRSKTHKNIKLVKKHTISGKLSQLQVPLQHMFQVRRHVLHKRKARMYLKCRVHNCCMAYITFCGIRELNHHHRIFHGGVTYQCPICAKVLLTPSSLCWHKYSHGQQLYKCSDCERSYVHASKLCQHCWSHMTQWMYHCFYGGCT